MRDGLSVDFRFVGSCRVSAATVVVFPIMPGAPGLYRIDFDINQVGSVYIGESADLRRRFRRYERPGPTQMTNLRIHGRIIEAVTCGGSVTVAVGRTAYACRNGFRWELDLGHDEQRLAVEAALIDRARRDGTVLENRRIHTLLDSVDLTSLNGGLGRYRGALP
jgi:hypothetical protein